MVTGRLLRIPVPPVVTCSNCQTEWNTTQKDCPRIGDTCKLCRRGTIEGER